MGSWKMGRIALFMMRKHLLKCRFLREELTNKANVFARKLRKLMFSKSSAGHLRLGQREYEFSCSNSPASTSHSRDYFSCLHPNTVSPISTALSHLDSSDEEDYWNTEIIVGLCDCGDVEVVRNGESRDVDREAEEFIASFYKKMKLQRQISFSQYEDMLARGGH